MHNVLFINNYYYVTKIIIEDKGQQVADSIVDKQIMSAGERSLDPFKVDLHCHILPKRWPDLKEVVSIADF